MGNSSSSRRRRQQRADAEITAERNTNNNSNNAANYEAKEDDTTMETIPSAPPLSSMLDDESLPQQPAMIRLASHTAALENKVCCVCSDTVEVGLGHLRLGCRCLLHDDCFVHYVRSKSKFDWIN